LIVQQDHAFDDAHEGPYAPPKKNEEAHQNEREQEADPQVEQPDPECPNLKTQMRRAERVSGPDLHMRDYDTDDTREASDEAREVENVNRENQILVVKVKSALFLLGGHL